MRRAARIASRRAGGEWLALYVTRHDGLSGVSPDQLADLPRKAEELGGTFHAVVGDDAGRRRSSTFARAENANQVDHRRQPPRPALDGASTRHRRAGRRGLGRHRRPHRHPRLRPPAHSARPRRRPTSAGADALPASPSPSLAPAVMLSLLLT